MKIKASDVFFANLMLVSAILIGFMIWILVGSMKEVNAIQVQDRFEFKTAYDNTLFGHTEVVVMTDTESGVQYLIIQDGSHQSVIPRLDGKGDYLFMR